MTVTSDNSQLTYCINLLRPAPSCHTTCLPICLSVCLSHCQQTTCLLPACLSVCISEQLSQALYTSVSYLYSSCCCCCCWWWWWCASSQTNWCSNSPLQAVRHVSTWWWAYREKNTKTHYSTNQQNYLWFFLERKRSRWRRRTTENGVDARRQRTSDWRLTRENGEETDSTAQHKSQVLM